MEGTMEKRMMDIKELGTYIGLRPQTIRNQISLGRFQIPTKRIGRLLKWDRREVDQYLDRLKKIKPAAFYVPSYTSSIEVGNFDDDVKGLRECDWVIEVVVEKIEIKKRLFSEIHGRETTATGSTAPRDTTLVFPPVSTMTSVA